MGEAKSTSLEALKDAVSESLQTSGVLENIRAKLRAEIFHTIEDKYSLSAPKPCNENLFINELIREYMEFNGYTHSLSVFIPESGQPSNRAISRPLMAHDLNLRDGVDNNASKLPLIYSMVAAMGKNRKEDYQNNTFLNSNVSGSIPAARKEPNQISGLSGRANTITVNDDHSPAEPLVFHNR